MKTGGQSHAPSVLLPQNIRYQLFRSLGWTYGHSGIVREYLPPSVFELRTVQISASRYTDYVIPAHQLQSLECSICLRGSAKIGYASQCSKSNIGYQLWERHWVCLVKRSLDVIGINCSLLSHLSFSKQYIDCLKEILGTAYKTNRIVGKRTTVMFH
jgi:hypothetical protein